MEKGSVISIISSNPSRHLYESIHSIDPSKSQIIIEKSIPSLENQDVLIIPCDNAWGIPSPAVSELLGNLGAKLEDEIKNYILQMYFGEQPSGTSFLLPWRSKVNTKYPRYICWTCMGRISSEQPSDYSYSALWSALTTINIFNKKVKKETEGKKKKEKTLKNIAFPDLIVFMRKDKGNSDDEDTRLRECSRQMAMALKTFFASEKIEIHNMKNAERKHEQILKEVKMTKLQLERELEGLVWSREIETRGLCSEMELDIFIDWINADSGARKISAAQTLCLLMRKEGTEYSLPKQKITERITGQGGCLPPLIDLGTDGKIQVHEEILRSDLVVEDKIGTGNAGQVFKGKWKGNVVAIKSFGGSSVDKKEFIKEVVMLSLVKHEHVVACYGASTKDGDKYLVEELMKSSLYDALHNKKFDLDDDLRMSFAIQCAKAMNFLHNCGLIHRDLKSLNLLINQENILKVCDFGLSRLVDKQMTSNIGTVAWIAPEVFSKKSYSEKADVYSYGVILWELVTRKVPFGDVEAFSVPLFVTRGERPELPKDAPKEWRNLIRRSWHQKPQLRPKFDEIIRCLTKLKADMKAEHERVGGDARIFQRKTKSSNPLFMLKSSTSELTEERSEYWSNSDDNSSSPTNSKPKSGSKLSGSLKITSRKLTVRSPGHRIVKVPPSLENIFSKAESEILEHFSDFVQDAERGTLETKDTKDRYLLLQGKALSLNFFNFVQNLFSVESPKGSLDGINIAQNLVFYIGRGIGAADAKQAQSKLADPLEMLSLIPVNLAYRGWASTKILEMSEFSSDPKKFLLVWEQMFSFEAECWKKELKENSNHTVCLLTCGYYTGWAQQTLKFPVMAVECLCKARGDATCAFVLSSSSKLENNVKRFATECKDYGEIKNETIPKFVKLLINNNGDPNQWIKEIINHVAPEEPINPIVVMSKKAKNSEKRRSIFFKKLNRSQSGGGADPGQSPLSVPKNKKSLLPAPKTRTGDLQVPSQLFIDALAHFNQINLKPDCGYILVGEEYYVMMRAGSIGTELYSVLLDLFGPEYSELAHELTSNLLYDFGRSIGQSDYLHYSRLVSRTSNPEKLRFGFLVNMALTGWGNGSLYCKYGEQINKNLPRDYYMLGVRIFETFEECHHRKGTGKVIKTPQCLLASAYISGWCEANCQTPLIAVEVCCNASNSNAEGPCEFVLSYPEQVEQFVSHYFEHGRQTPTKTALEFLAKTRSLGNVERPGMGKWLQKILNMNTTESEKT